MHPDSHKIISVVWVLSILDPHVIGLKIQIFNVILDFTVCSPIPTTEQSWLGFTVHPILPSGELTWLPDPIYGFQGPLRSWERDEKE